MSRIPFLAAVVAVALVSFLWLAARSRPMRGGPGIEPVLYASGLHQPRSLAFGADGVLYVAEAGWSGPGQAPVPGRISRVTGRDQTQVVLDRLPAAGSGQPLFAQSGPGALAADGTGLVLFFGPSDALPQGGVARLPAGAADPPVPVPLATGTPQSLPAAATWGAQGGAGTPLPAVLPLANLLVRVDPGSGQATPVTPFIGPGGGNPLPTAVARSPDGTLLVAHFGAQPFAGPGEAPAGRLVQVLTDGRWQPVVEGLRFPVGVAYSPTGRLFVLELAAGYDAAGSRFLPRSGRVLAIGPEPNRRQVVVRDVDYPTALAFAPNGDLYVTEAGAFRGPGEGRLLYVPGQSLAQLR